MSKAAVIITTYNWPVALDLVLSSVELQTCAPREIHIADDGSGEETRALVEKWRKRLSMPLHHHWHEDNGFRPNPMRNESAAQATSDVLITIDGDMIMHPQFVADHIAFSKTGHFIQSRRVRLSQALTDKAQSERIFKFPLTTKGIERRFQAVHNRRLAKLMTSVDTKMRHIRGANMSMWRSDFIAVNGLNEDIAGWGFEDHDLTARFYNLGLKRTYVRHAALAYHLEHGNRSRESKAKNKLIFEHNKNNKIVQVANGLAENHSIS
jgi:glycosyltransferase involved in cell wall biosynthesis